MTEELTTQQYQLETLISNIDLFTLCSTILKPEYFQPELQDTVKFILDYSEKYNALPDPDLINAETKILLTKREITKDIFQYSCDSIESFCKDRAFALALMEAVKLYGEGKLNNAKELIDAALLVSLEKDIGIEYFDNPRERLENQILNRSFISTGYKDLDKLLGGGMTAGQLIIFSGNSGSGKSMTLANIGVNLVERSLNVVYISLELGGELIGNRIDSLFTGLDLTDFENTIDETVQILTNKSETGKVGSMVVKYMPSGTNALSVKAYLKDYELKKGYAPDLIILDYLDIAGSNSNLTGDNISLKDKHTSEEFRNLANEYHVPMLSASQQNRSAIGLIEVDQSHIAGGLTKANTSDFWFAILATKEMKEDGIIKYICIKARSSDATGKSTSMKWNNSSCRISDHNSGNIANNIMNIQENIQRTKINKKVDIETNGGLSTRLIDITHKIGK